MGFVAVNLERIVVRIIEKGIDSAVANQFVCAITVIISENPLIDIDIHITLGGTMAVLAVEGVPVVTRFTQAFAEHKCHSATDGNLIGINAVAVVLHFHAIGGVPAVERSTTNNVHCRIGIQANEGNHD